MQVGIVKEAGDRRVAGTPETIKTLVRQGFEVVVERGAGLEAGFTDSRYAEAGATMVENAWAADVVLKVNPPSLAEADGLREGAALIGFVWPATNTELVARLATRGCTVLAMDQVPRISRAQKMDALSSLANIAGYRAVIEAANVYGSFFTGQVTAAGRVQPAKVLVIGAGVAGLAAVAAAKGLGAIVRAFDTRAAVKEQVHSLGAEFLEVTIDEAGEGQGGYAKEMSPAFIAAEMALFREQAKQVDIVITTALIPGRPAPKLWLADMVRSMKPGSVVVDLAARNGGNCELTVVDQIVVDSGVSIIGYSDLTVRLPNTASQLYGTNITHLIADVLKGAKAPDATTRSGLPIDEADIAIRGALVLRDGVMKWPAPPLPTPDVKKKPKVAPAPPAVPKGHTSPVASAGARPTTLLGVFGAFLAAWVALKLTGSTTFDPATAALLNHVTVFVLSCFVGWQVVWNVTPALHTPLMSVTNAISGIIIVGGVLLSHGSATAPHVVLGALAVLLATINIAGGFFVTERMLRMFRK